MQNQENLKKAEEFFLENFNVDRIFNSINRVDYFFLYYIRCLEQKSKSGKGVYLSELSAEMNIPMPELSKAVKSLQDKGYVCWEINDERNKTYIYLTNSAVELMNDELLRMKQFYNIIRSEIDDNDLKITLKTMKKISQLITDDDVSD